MDNSNIITSNLQKVLDEDGPSEHSEPLSALARGLFEQRSPDTQDRAEESPAMLIEEDLGSKETKIGC